MVFARLLAGWFPGRGKRSGGRRTRWRRRPYPAGAASAYARSADWGDRRSSLHREPVEVPAYEVAARKGEKAPVRFRWRGRWHRVTSVVGTFQDHRRPTSQWPERGRRYHLLETTPGGLCLLSFEPGVRRGEGRWILYRSIELLASPVKPEDTRTRTRRRR